MDILSSFQQHVYERQFFQKDDRLLLAVSGGIDSMALAHILLYAGFSFSVAHMNFQLRGEESNGDEQFVMDWGIERGVEVFIKRVDTEIYATTNKLGIQEAARELRYKWFDELLAEQGFICILTAHHAGDNIETILHNFFRGTGVLGMAGIREVRGKLVRPLLFAGRSDIEEYVKMNAIRYREDSSNLTDKYTRNFIRLDVIPMLKRHYPSLESNLNDNSIRFRKLADELDAATDVILKKLEWVETGIIKYPVLGLQKSMLRSQVLLKILLYAGFHASQLYELEKLLTAGSGKYIFSKSHRIIKDRKWVIIAPLKDVDSHFFIIEESAQVTHTGSGRLIQTPVETFKPSSNRFSQIVDASQITFPLIFRKWKLGDYFYPLGMKHKKKLSRFFIDQKLPVHEKEDIWVLESGKRIVWVVGWRIDERFAVRSENNPLLEISWKPSK